jgi:valyl-tRNA synthetase
VTFGTAVAQAEIEDRETPGTFIRLAFGRERGKPDIPAASPAEVVIATTRPELLPACVALVAHPDDERYSALFGSTATRRCLACRCRSWRTVSPTQQRARGW